MNLQMLDANENQSKLAVDLSTWVDSSAQNQDRIKFLKNHLIPDCSLKIDDFGLFIEARKKILLDQLEVILG